MFGAGFWVLFFFFSLLALLSLCQEGERCEHTAGRHRGSGAEMPPRGKERRPTGGGSLQAKWREAAAVKMRFPCRW